MHVDFVGQWSTKTVSSHINMSSEEDYVQIVKFLLSGELPSDCVGFVNRGRRANFGRKAKTYSLGENNSLLYHHRPRDSEGTY
jgi:hypothetical protein